MRRFPLHARLLVRRVALAAAVIAIFSGRAAGQAPQPMQGTSTRIPAPENPASGRPVFEFHSGFWVNLHHFLYEQARIRAERPTSRGVSAAPAGAATADAASTANGPDWSAALDYYASEVAGHDLLFDGTMVNVNNRLAEMETCADLSGRSDAGCASGLRPEIITVLERAAPEYRAHWWPAHDRANRLWIAASAPLVREMGGALAVQLAAVYRAPWPAAPIRVDVSHYGGPFGAYTTLDPTHITVSSSDQRNQGPAALEVLFHEASHALAGAVEESIARECRARNKPIPRDLWHALLFYTTGELVRRALTGSEAHPTGGSGAYTPYAYRNGLYARGWQDYLRVLERYWQPYLDGRNDFDTSLAQLVAGL